MKPTRILDVGSGASPYSTLFDGTKIVRLDLEARGAMEVLGDAHRLPFGDGSFDLVMATEVLEHVRRPQAVADELRRVVRPGGRLILTWPFMWGRHETHDFHRFTPEAVEAFFPSAEIRLERVESRGGIFTTMVALAARIPFELAQGHRLFGVTRIVSSIAHILLLPFFVVALFLDLADRRRAFTLGYQTLWKRSEETSRRWSRGNDKKRR